MIQVVSAGRDSRSQVIEAHRSLTHEWGVEAVFVDIFIDQPAAIPVCIELEESGFFFSGVQPDIKLDRDVLRLQIQRKPIDLELVKLLAISAANYLATLARSERESGLESPIAPGS